MEFWHNPRCAKSREALSLLQEKGIAPEIREYLKTPPNKEELTALIVKLGIKALDLVRKTEPIFKDEFKGKELSESEWVEVMVEHPKLIERLILIEGNKAVVGRPPVLVLDLL